MLGEETLVEGGFCATWYHQGSTHCYAELVYGGYTSGNALARYFKSSPHIVLPTVFGENRLWCLHMWH